VASLSEAAAGYPPAASYPHAAGYPLLVVAGPTASGKSTLALHMAQAFQGEIVSCDSVAVYRRMDIGSAKPSPADRALVPHHCLDLYWPNEACTAGDYARHARSAIASIRERGRLPIVAGGTGLYLRALLEGLAPAPPRNEALREKLRARSASKSAGYLHRILRRLDPAAAEKIHANDTPKLIRSLEVTLAGREPQSEQWRSGRDPLTGYSVLQVGLNPEREALYGRIDRRAAAMFPRGLVAETSAIAREFGADCRALQSLGYAQAASLLRGEMTEPQAIAAAQQGHRNYAKRQLTWFRRDPEVRWLAGFGDSPEVQAQAERLLRHTLAEAEPLRVQ
jgi:tRNA dimethylallyltransferase